MDLSDFAHDHATAELIGSKNFKQAIRNIDKKLKKSSNDIQATALKANLLLLTGDLGGSYALCSPLISKSPPITGQHILELIYHNLCELRHRGFDVDERQLDSLWQNAINAERNADKKVVPAKQWAVQSIRHGQWQQVVKAAMIVQKSLQGNSSQARNYWFWQIVARYMAGKTAKSEQLRLIQLGLALKTLEKAILDIPEDPVSDGKSGLWISSVAELKLLTCVLLREGKDSDVIRAIGKVPVSIQNDYAFSIDRSEAHRRLNDALGRWNDAKASLDAADEQHCQWLLDDSRPWSVLVEVSTSSFASQIDADIFSTAYQMAEHQASSKTFSRASRQALLKLRWHSLSNKVAQTNSSKEQPEMSTKIQICKEHFNYYADRPFALNDIEDKLNTFDRDESLLFSQTAAKIAQEKAADDQASHTVQNNWIVAEINALRVDLHFMKRDLGLPGLKEISGFEPALRHFTLSCLRLYELSLKSNAEKASTDFGIGDEVCLLANEAICLLSKYFEVSSADFYRACLLSELLAISEYNFDARTKHIGLLVQLGLYSSALSTYQELSIKDILHESMAPLVFARVSTSTPFASEKLDCRGLLEKPLKFFEEGIAKISSYQQLALESRNYAQVLEMEDLMQRLKDSPTRWLLALERRRTARLRNVSYDNLDLSFDVLTLPQHMNFDHLSPESKQYPMFHFGNMDNYISYVKYLAYLDLFHEALSSFQGNDTRIHQIMQNLQSSGLSHGLRSFDTPQDSKRDNLEACRKMTLLLSSLVAAAAVPSNLNLQVDELLDLSKTIWDDDRISFWASQLQKESFPRVAFCRECYATFELLQSLFKISDVLKTYVQQSQNTTVKAKRQEILKKTTELASTTTKGVKAMVDLASTISSQLPGKLAQELRHASFQSDNVSRAVRGIVTQNRITQVTAWYQQDSRIALEGLLNLKLRATRS